MIRYSQWYTALVLGDFDRFNVVGDLQLDGGLSVESLNGFQLTGGMQFVFANIAGHAAFTGGFYQNASENDIPSRVRLLPHHLPVGARSPFDAQTRSH